MKLLFLPLLLATVAKGYDPQTNDGKDDTWVFTDGPGNTPRDTVIKYAKDWVKREIGEAFGDKDFTDEDDPECHRRWGFRMNQMKPGENLPCKTWCVSKPSKSLMRRKCSQNEGGYFCMFNEPELNKDGTAFEQLSIFEKIGMRTKKLGSRSKNSMSKKGRLHCEHRIDDFMFTDGIHNTRESIIGFWNSWLNKKVHRKYRGNEDFTGNHDPACSKAYGLPPDAICHTYCVSKPDNGYLYQKCKQSNQQNYAGYLCSNSNVYWNHQTKAYERISYFEDYGASRKSVTSKGRVTTASTRNHCWSRYVPSAPKRKPPPKEQGQYGSVGLQHGLGPDGIPING